MNRLFLFVFLCLFAPVISATQTNAPQAPPKQSIQGKVVDGKTGQPIRKVNVTLAGGDPVSNYSVLTAADGSFSIDNPNPGRYTVTLEHNGFVPATLNRRQNSFTLQSGQALTGLVFKMLPAGVIFGKIVDPDGDPLASVSVNAAPAGAAPRGLQRFARGDASTNDLGEFRISNLRPGKYLISATPPPPQHVVSIVTEQGAPARTVSDSTNKPDDHPFYGTTYYPGALDKNQGIPIDVHAGEEAVANFGVLPTHAYRISGSVSGVPSGGIVQLMLVEKKGEPTANNVQLREGNRFEFDNVLPGSYIVTMFSAKGLETGQPQIQVLPMTPHIEVENADVTGLQLQAEPNGTVRGMFHLDTGEKFDWTQLNIGLMPVGDIGSGMFSALAMAGNVLAERPALKSDGSFELDQVPASTYQLWVTAQSNNFRDYYTKSITLAGREVADSGFTVNGDTFLDVVISAKGATLDGKVVDDKGEPVPNVAVAVVPNSDHPARPDSYQQLLTDDHGQFSVRGLTPGSYLVLAFDELAEDIRQPEFAKTYAPKAEKVDLDPSSQKSITVKLIPADDTP
jgi:protocatechuate 3,4-dioxygenase beta subunit